MKNTTGHKHLLKFLLTSSLSLMVGVMHGVLQVIPPIRTWLVSIGSPLEGPGRMIDPLAHAHISVLGGVVMFIMGTSYFLIPKMIGEPIFSLRLVKHTFWWTATGIFSMYTILMTFGIWEGLLHLTDPMRREALHLYFAPSISVAGSVMAIGFGCYFANLLLTIRASKITFD